MFFQVVTSFHDEFYNLFLSLLSIMPINTMLLLLLFLQQLPLIRQFNWFFWFSVYKTEIKIAGRLQSHLKLDWGRTHVYIHVIVDGTQFLVTCWIEGPSFLLAVGWRLSLVLYLTYLLNVATCFLKGSKGKFPCKTEVTVCCSIITYTLPCLLYSMSVSSKSQTSPTLQWGSSHKGLNTRRIQ